MVHQEGEESWALTDCTDPKGARELQVQMDQRATLVHLAGLETQVPPGCRGCQGRGALLDPLGRRETWGQLVRQDKRVLLELTVSGDFLVHSGQQDLLDPVAKRENRAPKGRLEKEDPGPCLALGVSLVPLVLLASLDLQVSTDSLGSKVR